MTAPDDPRRTDQRPSAPSPRPRAEGKVLIGVGILAAIVLALFLFADFGNDTAPVASTPGGRGLDAPQQVDPPEPAVPAEVPETAPAQQ